MIDKAATVLRAKVGRHIGRVDGATMRAVDHALLRFLELG
jgi:mRNA-degrading endonuclease toxin of MazEF toxin-antitoxin module